MPAIDRKRPCVRFRSSARKVQEYLNEIFRIDDLIHKKEDILRHDELFTKNPGLLPVSEELRRLKLLRLSYEKAVSLVLGILDDIKNINVDMYYAVYSVYVCHRDAAEIAECLGVDSHHLCVWAGKAIASVMSPERMNTIDLLESMINALQNDSESLRNEEKIERIQTLNVGRKKQPDVSLMS